MTASARALVSPQADFWLLGGASFVFMLVITGLPELPRHLGTWAYGLSFLVNFPHFLYSYQVFYAGFSERLRSPASSLYGKSLTVAAGVIVPALLIAYFGWAYGQEDNKPLMGYAVSAMLLFVGWHYVKQGYGVLITCSVYKSVFYNAWQKRILYGNAYAVWAYTWLRSNETVWQRDFFGMPYGGLGLPHGLALAAGIVAVITTALSVFILAKKWHLNKKDISWNGLTGYASATYLWVVFSHNLPDFFMFVPFFHSLQYLPFVYKLKASEFRQEPVSGKSVFSLCLFVTGGFVLGALFMDVLPPLADRHLGTGTFVLAAVLLLINIQHYFIDSSFWRRDNARVQKFLFRA